MTMRAESNFEYADKRLSKFKVAIPKRLNNARLRLATFDELNIAIITKFYEVEYAVIERKAVEAYFDIYKKIYKEAYDLAVSFGYEDGTYNPLWLGAITDWLLECDATTGYVFTNEIKRKQDRLIEKIVSLLLNNKSFEDAEVLLANKRASKYISDQITEYGDLITYKAMKSAYEDAGVDEVVWLSEYDDKVCDTCLAMNGLVFPIDRVPAKPHWGCRCWLVPRQRSR